MSNTLKQDKDFNAFQRIKNKVEKRVMQTKTINVADILTYQDREAIAKIVDQRVAKEYGDMYDFNWQMNVSGHFEIPETL